MMGRCGTGTRGRVGRRRAVGTGDVRCLWLSRDMPYPALSGRRVYTAGLTEALAEAGVDVHGLGLDDDTDHEVRTQARWAAAGRAAPVSAGRRLLSRWPAMAVNCMTPAYRRVLGATLQQQRWDVSPSSTTSRWPGP